MVDKFVHNNPQDPTKERFARLKEQVTNISRNMSLLMAALASKLEPYEEAGGSNSKIGSEGKSGDNEDPEKESRKGLEKDQPSLSVVNPSQSIFKMEAKVGIKPYQGEINALKLNHWLRQLEVYFSIHHIDEEQKISFSKLKLEGHALTWWESHTETLRLEGDPPVTKWKDFKTLRSLNSILLGM
jgi:hypothetical protein